MIPADRVIRKSKKDNHIIFSLHGIMERYTQNRAHLLQKYIVVALEVLLLIYGFRLGLWLLGDTASQVWANTESGPLLLVLMVFAWLGVGSNINHYHYEAILQIKYLLKT
ncbi:MAG: hypothetical protein AAGM67_12340, partial [Bacteroidota bacterium]